MAFRHLGPPPPQRPNWNSLNRGQRLYAVRQYNIALARRNLPPFVLGEEVVVQPDIVSEEEGSETFVVPDDYDYETDSDLDWNFDGGINPNTPRDVQSPMSGPTSTTPDSKRGNDSGQGGSGSKKTKLPGTGRQTADDPDTGNPSLENAVIPRPIHKSTGYTMVFRKKSFNY